MSDFIEMFSEMLPANSELQKPNNQLRKVLDRSVGEYMDAHDDIFDELFLTSADGGWLDAHGKDYGVLRNKDESDDDYRQRIIFEKLENLTAHNLQEIYGLSLYEYVKSFNANSNTLTSDNGYMSNKKMSIANDEIKSSLNNKFILEEGIYWLDDNSLDYIINTNNEDVLENYTEIYTLNSLRRYFRDDTSLKEIHLNLHTNKYMDNMFDGCSNLVNVNLNSQRATHGKQLFRDCSKLVNVKLHMPRLLYADSMFRRCYALPNITLSLPKLKRNSGHMFRDCSSLVTANLDFPSLISTGNMFNGCTSLTRVTLNVPSMEGFSAIFGNMDSLEYLNVNIPEEIVDDFKTYIFGKEFENLTTFIINNEGVPLS